MLINIIRLMSPTVPASTAGASRVQLEEPILFCMARSTWGSGEWRGRYACHMTDGSGRPEGQHQWVLRGDVRWVSRRDTRYLGDR